MTNQVKYGLLLSMCLPFLAFAKHPLYEDYIAQYQHVAIQEMDRTGIPASVKMAQAILESGAGTSTLSSDHNNHFGIKCGKDWKGKTYYHKDDDYNAQGKLIKSCFRKYSSAEESFYAHSEFLMVNRRYGFLFALDQTDYHGWATGLKKAGYATSKTYASKLINLIDDYQLYLLDTGSTPGEEFLASTEPIATPPSVEISQPKPTRQPVEEPAIVEVEGKLAMVLVNEVQSVKARRGDTPQSIAEAMGNSAKRLVRYNEFLEYANQAMQGGERIFLQPKRSTYRGKRKDHFIKKGETMFDISQTYGIRLASLYERNRLNPGVEPATGSRIRLRGPRVKANETPKAKFKGKSNPIRVPDYFDKKKDQEVITASTGNEEFSTFKPATSFSEKRKEEQPGKPWYEEEEILKENEAKPLFVKNSAPQQRPKIIHNGPQDNEEYTGGDRTTISKPTPVVTQEEPSWEESVETPIEKPTTVEVIEKPVVKPPVDNSIFHQVKKGETLYRISVNFGVSVDKIKALNNLSSNIISVGQRLRIQ